jgi:hypothetical protein
MATSESLSSVSPVLRRATTIVSHTVQQLIANRSRMFKVDDTLGRFEQLIELHRKSPIEITEIKLYALCQTLHKKLGPEYANQISITDISNIYPLSRLSDTGMAPKAIERKLEMLQMEDESIVAK